MSTLDDQLKQPSLFTEQWCDVSLGKFLPDIHPREAAQVTGPCSSLPGSIVTCKNKDYHAHVAQVDGLSFSTVSLESAAPDLEPYTPIIDRVFFNKSVPFIPHKVVGVSLEDIFSSPGKPQLKYLRDDLLQWPFFKNRDVVLFATGKDKLIEDFWFELGRGDLLVRISKMGFLATTGINFSIFDGECSAAQRLNLKKSLFSAKEFEGVGITTIPHIYMRNKDQARAWLIWLQNNPAITTVSINCQFRDKLTKALTIDGIKFLVDNLGRPILFLLEGVDRQFLIQAGNYSRYFRVAVKGPSLDAQFHKKYIHRNSALLKGWDPFSSVESVLRKNILSFGKSVESILLKK